jgi:hypothetical protein
MKSEATNWNNKKQPRVERSFRYVLETSAFFEWRKVRGSTGYENGFSEKGISFHEAEADNNKFNWSW